MARSMAKAALVLAGVSCLAAWGACARAQGLNLGDIAAGGDGSGTASAGQIGIDPRNGQFATAPVDGHIQETDPEADGLNPSPVPGSNYIDSVFFIGPALDPTAPTFAQAITQSGVTFDFPTADGIGTGWNHILKDGNGGEAGLPIEVGGVGTWASAVGIHSSTGITYDLNAVRATHGNEAVGCLSTNWGMDACGGGVVLYAILANDASGVLSERRFRAGANAGELMQMAIPAEARYLILATGSDGGDGCDHGTFADAFIGSAPCSLPAVDELRVSPPEALLGSKGTVQLRVTGITGSTLPLDLTAAATGTTYSAAPAGVVTVGADGLVAAVSLGRAEVTASNGGKTAVAVITVADFIDLGDIVGGGNGLLTKPDEMSGVRLDADSFLLTQDLPCENNDSADLDGLP
ncbi:MAG: NPCBM/NEW2 domain-containing protein, partial [Planctomycetes bacterium]|nr:NPCBM/NEW2 domain-containing protein [Planctomycetota bacterium]